MGSNPQEELGTQSFEQEGTLLKVFKDEHDALVEENRILRQALGGAKADFELAHSLFCKETNQVRKDTAKECIRILEQGVGWDWVFFKDRPDGVNEYVSTESLGRMVQALKAHFCIFDED